MEQLKHIYILGGRQEIMEKYKLEDEKDISQWFQKNKGRLKKAACFNPFWSENLLKVRKGQQENPYVLLRKLDELGYKKQHLVTKPGQYAHRGGLIDVYPINCKNPVHIEFVGNNIEAITPFDAQEAEDIPFAVKDEMKKTGFEKGYYVVHVDHGIAQYEGQVKREGKTYFKLAYKGKDILLVPRSLGNKITPYIGFSKPRIHRLGDQLWQKTKKKAREDTVKWAKRIIKSQAKRKVAKRPPYGPDDELQKSLEGEFEYSLTPDQQKALNDVKSDLQGKKLMDRIICGDVGFGKTEIALRAAFKVASSGRQVAFMTPTTILAEQHFETFKKRLKGYPVKVALLSRVLCLSKEKKVIEGIKTGNIDIVVGTHRLLSKDVDFRDLGLLVIDEEQKFGVRHKQKLQKKKEGIDVLSLSATPIPRTLKLALSKIKDISLIQTPPPQKQPIKTYIYPLKKELIKKAINKELKRGGQVFYLHNRVATITNAKKQLKKLLPKPRFRILHAQMPAQKIIETMRQFRKGEFDILVATTIIENGLDLANVNTLLVEDATRLGLAQAHQLRGRIGRQAQKAYAWFFYQPSDLSTKASRRLRILKQFSYLGAGHQIALRDLEMRGAGEILGKKQAGTIQAVGLNMYYELIKLAVEKLKNKEL